jgi:hypothetical protein
VPRSRKITPSQAALNDVITVVAQVLRALETAGIISGHTADELLRKLYG